MSGKNVEEAGEDFSFVAAGPAISLDRFGMGEEGKVGSEQREGEQKRVPRKGNTCDESSRVSRTLPGEMHAGKGILDSSRNYKNTHPTVEA